MKTLLLAIALSLFASAARAQLGQTNDIVAQRLQLGRAVSVVDGTADLTGSGSVVKVSGEFVKTRLASVTIYVLSGGDPPRWAINDTFRGEWFVRMAGRSATWLKSDTRGDPSVWYTTDGRCNATLNSATRELTIALTVAARAGLAAH